MTVELLQVSLAAAALSAFLIGLSFGSGPCNLSCLPYLGPVLLGPASRKPFGVVLLPFMGGRLLGYTTLGVIAAAIGQILQSYLEHPAIPVVIAGVTLWLAIKMWRQAKQQKCISASQPAIQSEHRIITTDAVSGNEKNRVQLFLLGFSLAFNPCIPLLGLLSAAAQSADVIWGGVIAISFGLGAIVVPSMLVRYGVALLGKELRTQLADWQVGLTRTGALMLILVAVNTAWRGIPG